MNVKNYRNVKKYTNVKSIRILKSMRMCTESIQMFNDVIGMCFESIQRHSGSMLM